MKKVIWTAVLTIGVAGLCSAQVSSKSSVVSLADPEESMESSSQWKLAAGLIYKNWLFEHDGLQARVPSSSKMANDWRDGDTDGNGWGFKVNIGKGDGELNITFTKSDVSYNLEKERYYMDLDTTARDLEISWSQVRGKNDQAVWGTTLGFRYLGTQKSALIVEGEGNNPADDSGNITWLMLMGGYNAKWSPFDTDIIQFYGSLLFFLGEAEGPARDGKDENWTNDKISETYSNQYSLGYGTRAQMGVDLAVTKRFRVTAEYMREWLYSFDASNSGIVVFPDNSDALFIETSHAVQIGFNYIF